MNRDILSQMQQYPLWMKIEITKRRIREWYEYWDGDVYVSYSGGKDSTVLLHIAR
jgi:3'-phosphoadenosine 5'-phosphosulfate sulfotransferase (PAPS reductase)/FAD synthetase